MKPSKAHPQAPDPAWGTASADYDSLLPMEDDAGPIAPIPFQKLVVFLLRYWWLPLVTLVLALSLAVGYVWTQPPVYVSTGRMWKTEQLSLQEAAFTQDLQNFFGTQAELLRSSRLREQAAETLKSGGAARLGPGQVRIQVTQVPKSTVFDVVALGPEPIYTQAFLDALMNQYLAYKRDVHRQVAGGTQASIVEQVKLQERDLKEKQNALSSFEHTNNLAVMEEEGKVAGSYLAELKTKLSEYTLEKRLLQATAVEQRTSGASATNQTSDLAEYVRVGPIGAASGHADRLTAYRELELLKAQRDKLGRFLRPKHPKIVKLSAEIEKGEKLIELYRRQSLEQLGTALQAVEMKIENVLGSIKDWEQKVTQANSQIAEAEGLRQEVIRAQNVYDRTMVLQRQIEMGGSLDQEELTVLEPASPALQSHKQELIVLGLAALVGLGAGLGIVLVVAVRDDRFNSLQEVKEQLSERVVGQVPEVLSGSADGQVPLLALDDSRPAFSESYRSLRSAILFLDVEKDLLPRTLLITSAMQGEGKSTVAVNLARALAMGGSRVLLVDADLRRGALHDRLCVSRAPGLTDLLCEPSLLSKIVHSKPSGRRGSRRREESVGVSASPAGIASQLLPNLSFIARGSEVNNPGDLLLNPVFGQLLAKFRRQYDYVLIDSCPVFAADEATSLAPKVDATLLVVRNRFSRLGQVREALDLLYQRQAKVLGIVFNRTNSKANSYYYYTDSSYHIPVRSHT